MIPYHYYTYNYSYDDKKDIDIIGDNKSHSLLYYYYIMNNEYNYEMINNNIELYFESLNNNNNKLSIINGKIILISNNDNNDNNKDIYYDINEFYGAYHSIQFGKVKNNTFSIDNIDSKLLIDLNELEQSLKESKISDILINNGLNKDLFNDMWETYKNNNYNFNYVKEYYGYTFKLDIINVNNNNPIIRTNEKMMLFINLNGEIYINFINIDETTQNITINSNIFKKNQNNDYIYKDYYIIPSNELIFNKYIDLKFINYSLSN